MMMMMMIIIIIVFRYEFASPEVLAGTTETLRKETLCMFTPDEVAHIISARKIWFMVTMISLLEGASGGGKGSQAAPTGSSGGATSSFFPQSLFSLKISLQFLFQPGLYLLIQQLQCPPPPSLFSDIVFPICEEETYFVLFFQVVFANQQCLACGQKGDPRLMEDKVRKVFDLFFAQMHFIFIFFSFTLCLMGDKVRKDVLLPPISASTYFCFHLFLLSPIFAFTYFCFHLYFHLFLLPTNFVWMHLNFISAAAHWVLLRGGCLATLCPTLFECCCMFCKFLQNTLRNSSWELQRKIIESKAPSTVWFHPRIHLYY